ncbi:MAG: efflux RND transporter periplasmic adaptor subunit [Blastocatellia bacterium]|nr:efflux RND transporter periplasmic adaptor subunit [Blastocatellia bacterium]
MPRKEIFVLVSKRKGFFAVAVVLLIASAAGVWAFVKDSNATPSTRITEVKANTTEEVGVQVALPERHEITRQVVLPGSVEAFEQAALYAKTAGYLKWIKVDIGDRVEQDQVLAEIDVPEMANEFDAAQAEVARAEANITNAEAELERARAEVEMKKITYERLKGIRDQEPDVLPQQEVDEAKAQFDVARAIVNVAESKIKVAHSEKARAEAARSRLVTLMEYTKIRAPFSGVVVKRHVDPGALIQHASSQTNVSPVVTIARVDRLRVFIDVAELEVPLVRRGNPVALTVDALPGRNFEGTCTRFAGALDPKTRTMKTEIDIPNRDGLLRPGMYASVRLSLGQRKDALTVPASALIVEGDKTYVYTVASGVAHRVEVQTGSDDGIQVEITEGLTGSEPVIITGKTAVKDGTPVKLSQASS